MKKRVAILISGGGSNMVALAQSMGEDHPARPVLVLSNRPDAGGIAKAQSLGIPTAVLDHRDPAYQGAREPFETAMAEKLDAVGADILCFAGFMRIVTAGFVTRYAGRCLNIHPSLLPAYPGLNTHARALAAGEKTHGCTVHEVTPELDAGPILGQARVPVLDGDTEATLAARVLVAEHQIYPAVLRRFAQGDQSPVFLGERPFP